jgi:hypothetical protein
MKRSWSLLLLTALMTACGGGGGNGDPSSNANLSSLIINTADLVPAFSSGTLNYTATVANSVSTVTVTPTTQVSLSSVTVDGVAVASGVESQAIDLVVGDTSVSTLVTAEAGNQRDYRVVITRLPPPGDNAALAELALSVSELDQLFEPNLFDYTASAGFFGASTRVLATPEDAAATVQLEGRIPLVPATPSEPLPLTTGSNDLDIVVTAEDGTTTQAYQVTVERAILDAVDQEAYIKASNPDPDNFAASLAAQADTLIAGAPLEASAAIGIDGDQADNSFFEAGAAYIYARDGVNWSQRAYVKASNTDSGDVFGISVALGERLVAIGASGEQSRAAGINGVQSDNSGNAIGAVYLFAPDAAGVWQQTDYVKASNPDSGDRFGGALALTDSGLAVGARFEQSAATGINGNQTDDSLSNAGAAYLFTNSNGGWQQAAYVKASNTDAGDEFGGAIALSAETLAIGASGENSGAVGVGGDQSDNSAADSGAVYLFTVDAGSLSQSAYVKASNTDSGDRFGAAVSVDADLLAVGAPGEDSASSGVDGDQSDNSLLNTGAVYIFERDADGDWRQEAYLKASNPGLQEGFGAALELRGNLLVVGAVGEGSASTGINGDETDESAPNSGAAYVFERDEDGTWEQIAYVKASNTDQQDGFGFAVSIARDSVVAGAPGEQSRSAGVNGVETDNSIDGAGAIYVLR